MKIEFMVGMLEKMGSMTGATLKKISSRVYTLEQNGDRTETQNEFFGDSIRLLNSFCNSKNKYPNVIYYLFDGGRIMFYRTRRDR